MLEATIATNCDFLPSCSLAKQAYSGAKMTMSGKIMLVAAAAVLSLPASLSAQEASDSPADPDNEIVVTGVLESVTPRQVERQARDIAVNHGSIRDTPLARFEDRLCPGVVGLEEDFAFAFNARIRANATTLGIRLARDECRPNFVVVFADDGEAIFRSLIDDSPEYFRFLNSGEIAAILETGPVHVWTGVEPRTLTGMPIPQVRDLTSPPRIDVAGAHSRIYTPTRNDIATVMITFDRAAVRGMSLRQLADYATMRGLAQTRVPEEPEVGTILSLFDTAAAPLELTEFDRAYLRSLYDGIPNLPAFRKLFGTTRQLRLMAEEADEGAAGE